MDTVHRLIAVVLLLLLTPIAYADSYTGRINYSTNSNYGSFQSTNRDEVKDFIINQMKASAAANGGVVNFVGYFDNPNMCAAETRIYYDWTPAGQPVRRQEFYFQNSCSCPYGGTMYNPGNYQPPRCDSAPACPAGQARQPDGSCGAPPPPECESGCNGACGSYKTFKGLRSRACIDGCIYKLGAGLSVSLSTGETSAGHDVRDNTGESCEGVEDTPTPPNPCPECECQKQGKSWASMNGTTVCLNPGTPGSQPVTKQDPPQTKTETPAPTPENPNPEPVTTETPSPVITITPSPGGGSPDITETTTNPDGSTTSTTQSQSSYCQKNPTASVCKQADEDKKKGSWSGSCGAFQCEGDAVNCAISRKIHQDRCDDLDDMQQFDNAASLGKKLLNGEHEADVSAFLNGEGDGNKTINVGGLVSESGSYQFAAQCLPDIQFSIGGQSITVPISKVCPYFEMIGFFLLAAAYLAALRIVEVI